MVNPVPAVKRLLSCLLLLLALPLAHAEVPAPSAAADLILRNGRIYTVAGAQRWATAVAIGGGRFLAVGDDKVTAAWAGQQTRVVDLHQRLVLPAFLDAHTHPVPGGLSYSQCPLFEGKTAADYQRLVGQCAAARPGDGWVYGVGWRDGVFTPEGVPTKELLDAVVPDRPAAFLSVGGHSIWLNSKALQAAGITKQTADPPNGRIDRNERGEPVGALQESAVDLILAILPAPTAQERENALRYALGYFNSVGVVGWHDADVPIASNDPLRIIDTYESLQAAGSLRAHVSLALHWDNARGLEQLPEILAAARTVSAHGLHARTVKFFLDGVLAQRTAALVEPYSDQPGFRGELEIPVSVLNEAVAQLDAQGFQVHVHAIGDRAVQAALDAFAAARVRNGKKDNRHLISHANLVRPADRVRCAELGVVVVLQPLWAWLDDYMRLTAARVGPERLAQMYPARGLLRAGATIAYGSDWAVASADPLRGIEVALTRREPGATHGERLAPSQRVTLTDAIRNYTLNAAYAMHEESNTGSIEVGKSADLVVLDHDLFRIPANQIGSNKVLVTLYAGAEVYGKL